MPMYSYRCTECGHSSDQFHHMTEETAVDSCPRCGGEARRMFRPPQVSIRQPFFTRHITGEPIEIRSAKQEEEVCKRHGVTRCDTDSIPVSTPVEKRVPFREDFQRTLGEMGLPQELKPYQEKKRRKRALACA